MHCVLNTDKRWRERHSYSLSDRAELTRGTACRVPYQATKEISLLKVLALMLWIYLVSDISKKKKKKNLLPPVSTYLEIRASCQQYKLYKYRSFFRHKLRYLVAFSYETNYSHVDSLKRFNISTELEIREIEVIIPWLIRISLDAVSADGVVE